MKNNQLNRSITTATFLTLLKVGFIGVLSGEAWYLGQIIAQPLNASTSSGSYETWVFIVSGVVIILLVSYGYCRNFYLKLAQVGRSMRLDLLVIMIMGVAVSVSFGGIGSDWYAIIITPLTIIQLCILISLPVVVGLARTPKF